MGFESIAMTVVVGALAGWLAGYVMKGGGYGLLGDITLGVVGGVVGGVILWMQGTTLVEGRFSLMAAAFVAGFILVVIQRKFWNVQMPATK